MTNPCGKCKKEVAPTWRTRRTGCCGTDACYTCASWTVDDNGELFLLCGECEDMGRGSFSYSSEDSSPWREARDDGDVKCCGRPACENSAPMEALSKKYAYVCCGGYICDECLSEDETLQCNDCGMWICWYHAVKVSTGSYTCMVFCAACREPGNTTKRAI